MARRKLSLPALIALAVWPCAIVCAQNKPAVIEIANSPIPIRVLVQSPADTNTDLQVICLFRSSPVNTLHGALTETNEKLQGLLDRVRSPQLFRGELGETLLIAPPKNSLGAKKLLVIRLGDSQTFSPQRMQLLGEMVYREASNLGVTKFTTGQVAEQMIGGFLRACRDGQCSQGCECAGRSGEREHHARGD